LPEQGQTTTRSISCPHCGRTLKITSDLLNKRITCSACKKKINLVSGPPKPKGPPPVPDSARPWHLHVLGRNVGPYTADTVREQLKAGKISPDTLAWKDGQEDWLPVGEVREFREGRRPATHIGKADGPRERRSRYVPGKSKRDVVIGAWVAVGLAVILLVVILVVMNQPKPKPEARTRRRAPAASAESDTSQGSDTAGTDASGAKDKESPQPSPPGPSKGKQPRQPPDRLASLTREQVMARLKKELDEDFAKAIADHKAAKTKAIILLYKRCDRWAADLKRRQDWGPYQSLVDRLAERLTEAATAMQTELPERSRMWIDPENLGVSQEDAAESLRLNDYAWIANWQKIVNEELDRIRNKGLAF
jgi:hypothetical protein